MKTAIHPQYYETAKIRCACGAILTVGSTMEDVVVELCSACHPFYTGKQKLIDTEGRVEKFHKKIEKKSTVSAARKGKKVKRQKTAARKTEKKKTEEQ